MSLVGTRPPLIGEVSLYELHHRAKKKKKQQKNYGRKQKRKMKRKKRKKQLPLLLRLLKRKILQKRKVSHAGEMIFLARVIQLSIPTWRCFRESFRRTDIICLL